MPVWVSGTSVQPVNRFSRFQVDSPWRISTSLYMGGACPSGCRAKPGILESRVARHGQAKETNEICDRQLDDHFGRAGLGPDAAVARIARRGRGRTFGPD